MDYNTNMENKLKIAAGLIALIWIAYGLIWFGALLNDNRSVKSVQGLSEWTAVQIVLARQCRAKWPQMKSNYDKCVDKVRGSRVYRRDI